MSLPNVWHHRKVAEVSAKSCEICYKPCTSVLITPDNRDFFYVCPIHLEDRGFASPIVDTEAEAARKRKEALDREIERVKIEYEEKMKRKAAEKAEQGCKGDEDQKGKEDKKDEDAKSSEKEKNDKIKSLQIRSSEGPKQPAAESPRIFALHNIFYQMRLDRIRNREVARRNRERLNNPNLFPSVPKNDL